MDLRSFYVDLFSDPMKLRSADEIILAEINRSVASHDSSKTS